MPILTTNEFVEKYNSKQGLVEGGSLCFYGHWFGRPYDNYHQLESVSFDQGSNKLILTFNEKEILTILNPQNIVEDKGKLSISLADNIFWSWFYYGKVHKSENLCFIEITRIGDSLTGTSNIDSPDFKDLDIHLPALLLG